MIMISVLSHKIIINKLNLFMTHHVSNKYSNVIINNVEIMCVQLQKVVNAHLYSYTLDSMQRERRAIL